MSTPCPVPVPAPMPAAAIVYVHPAVNTPDAVRHLEFITGGRVVVRRSRLVVITLYKKDPPCSSC